MLVTNNAIEFRGRYRDIALHPGVIFLLPAACRAEQLRLLEAALHHVSTDRDMVNRALEVAFDPNRAAVVTAYDLPEPGDIRRATAAGNAQIVKVAGSCLPQIKTQTPRNASILSSLRRRFTMSASGLFCAQPRNNDVHHDLI